MDLDVGEFMMLAPNREGGVTLGLQRVPEPRTGKNRVHVDLGTTDRAAEVRRLVELGATEVSEHEVPGGLSWTVLTDPEGNEFCVASRQHLAFSPGIHYSPGALLARLEAEIAFRNLATRLPYLRRAETPTPRPTSLIHGLSTLPTTTNHTLTPT